MRTRLLYFILICALGLASCQRQSPPFDTIEENVFGVVGNIDNAVRGIYAGNDDFYMVTSHEYDANNDVVSFMGTLDRTCSACPESMRFIIRNNRYGQAVDADAALGARPIRFYYDKTVVSGYKVIFAPSIKGNGPVTHRWDFGDGTYSTKEFAEKDFAPTGNYTITYTATYPECSSSIAYPVNLSPEVAGSNNLGFGYTYIGGDSVLLSTDSSFTNILWDLGNGNYSTSRLVTIRVPAGKQLIKLFKFAANDTIQVWKNVASPTYLGCNANFAYTVKSSEHRFPPHSDIVVEWTDASGRTYSSAKVAQPSGYSFRIIRSEPYLPNEKGQATRKLTIAFDCLLSDGSRTISVTGMQGVIAVAHP